MRFSCPFHQRLIALLVCLLVFISGGQAKGLVHPYLLFETGEIGALRGKFDDPRYQPIKLRMVERADQLLTYTGDNKYDGDPQNFDGRSYKVWADKGDGCLSVFTWAYILTGDKRYSSALLSLYRHEWRIRNKLNQNEFRFEFKTKGTGFAAAVAYDVLWPLLNEEDRQAFGVYLDQYLVFKEKPTFGWKNNIGLGYFSAVGLIAMARLDENPRARAILDQCISRLKKESYPSSILPHPDGAYPEGPLYGDYMFSYLLPFIERYEKITGDTRHGLWEPAFFQNTHRMVEVLTGGDGVWTPVYDSQPQSYGATWTAIMGRRTGNDLLRWTSEYYLDQILAEKEPAGEVGRSLISAVINRNWKERVAFPGLPTLAMLPSINTGSMRSDRTLKPGLMVTVRGYGEKEINMRGQHKDVGSFLLYARGENFLIDPGYYQPEAEAHSMPQIDGIDVQARMASPLLGDEKDTLRTLAINPTQSYKKDNKAPVEIRRCWIMAGDKAVVLVDDIQAPAGVVSRFQAGFATEILPGETSALIKGKSSRLWLGAFGPATRLAVTGPLDFGKSWTYKKMADAGQVSWHRLEAPYQNNPGEPMIWVFVPLADGEVPPAVRVERGESRIEVKLPGHSDVVVEKTSTGWQAAGLHPRAGEM